MLRGGDGRLGRSLDPILLYSQSYHSWTIVSVTAVTFTARSVHSRAADDVKGTPDAPPHGSYEGGVLPGIRVLGAFLGGFVWCRDKLVKRVRKALEPLPGILALRDGDWPLRQVVDRAPRGRRTPLDHTAGRTIQPGERVGKDARILIWRVSESTWSTWSEPSAFFSFAGGARRGGARPALITLTVAQAAADPVAPQMLSLMAVHLLRIQSDLARLISSCTRERASRYRAAVGCR